MPRAILRCIAVLMILIISPQASGQNRTEVIEILNKYCGVSTEVWAAAGFSNTEVIQSLSLIHDTNSITVAMASQENLTNLKTEYSSCLEQLRSPSQFEDEASSLTEEQLETQLVELGEQIETTEQTLSTAIASLRITALSSRLNADQITRVTGESGAWGSLPIHWRFGNVEESELPNALKAHQTSARFISAGEDISAEANSIISSIESQYPVALAQVRIQSSSESIKIAIEQWLAESP